MARKPYCETCKIIGTYNEKWDAYYCGTCDIWLDDKCSEVPLDLDEFGESQCWFSCWDRPNKPSAAY